LLRPERFAALKSLDDRRDFSRAWDNVERKSEFQLKIM
jgi:hypothetical protein